MAGKARRAKPKEVTRREMAFLLYCALGTQTAVAARMGLSISAIEKWSTADHWVERAREAELKAKVETQIVDDLSGGSQVERAARRGYAERLQRQRGTYDLLMERFEKHVDLVASGEACPACGVHGDSVAKELGLVSLDDYGRAGVLMAKTYDWESDHAKRGQVAAAGGGADSRPVEEVVASLCATAVRLGLTRAAGDRRGARRVLALPAPDASEEAGEGP